MVQFETKIKKWGNSMGIILPKEIINKESLKIEEKIEVIIVKNPPKVKDIFGTIKDGLFKKNSTVQIMKKIKEELYHE